MMQNVDEEEKEVEEQALLLPRPREGLGSLCGGLPMSEGGKRKERNFARREYGANTNLVNQLQRR